MRNLPNIEPSAFREGEYIGYADGIWRIRKSDGKWAATQASRVFRAATLEEMSTMLTAYVQSKNDGA